MGDNDNIKRDSDSDDEDDDDDDSGKDKGEDGQDEEEEDQYKQEYILPDHIRQHLENEGFLIQSFLGNGSYSHVFKAITRSNRSFVAVKSIELSKQPNIVRNKYLWREIEISLSISHKNIIRTHQIIEYNNEFIFMVTDFADGGDLITILERETDLNISTIKEWFSQIVRAVKFIHSKGIAHRDIKPDNVLIENGIMKLSDFGYARVSVDSNGEVLKTDSFCGTYEYLAPEVILRKEPFDPIIADNFSLGVLLYLMISFNFPFGYGPGVRTEKGFKKFNRRQLKQKWKLPQKYNNDVLTYSLLRQLLNPDVSSRIKSSQILGHPFFFRKD